MNALLAIGVVVLLHAIDADTRLAAVITAGVLAALAGAAGFLIRQSLTSDEPKG